ncbi:DUF885 family protein [Chitinophaga japonensis]|uniref:Uncharacterized protein DUF885 n=1 Tax=Chitinophaga japonensis TaxID=104662 RepID=A0A562T6A6_CHIJA|nr:DUF885 family protein [Chitinophaga japonensis]TWI89055.1 uncharacterized protein DUF885 [Chitinophaga japonensis]
MKNILRLTSYILRPTSYFLHLTSYLLLLTSSTAFAQQQSPLLYLQTSEVNDLMVHYQADKGSISRFYFVNNSPERRQQVEKLDKQYLQQLEELDFNTLPVGSRVDYLLFREKLQQELHGLQEEATQYQQLNGWFPFAEKLYAIEKLRRRGTEQNAQQLAASFHDMASQINKKAKALEQQQEINIDLVLRAEGIVKGLQNALQSVHKFYNGYDPQYTWWAAAPYKELDSALNLYARVWKEHEKTAPGSSRDSSGIIGYPVGRTELIRQLQEEMIPYTPEDLIAIANKEFAWCDAEMLKASREMGFGDDWKKALEKVKNTYVPPGKQPEAIMDLYNQSIDFLQKHDLVTIPPLAAETWRMIMMTPERQRVNPFFTGGEVLSISYPTDDMSEEDKLMSMRGNNPHFSRATVHHELIAGHHLQMYMCRRYKTYRDFRTPFWIEGWALYWEMLLWDQQFPRSPEDRVGMLFWRMHRCARIIFSLNFHLGKWTPQQCIDFLVDRVGHERANAEGEVRRSFVSGLGYSPLYQLAYMIGGLQFYALKKELVDSGKMTLKQYHDAVLQQNMMPVEMVRAILTNQRLPEDFKTNWKFYSLK